MRSDILSLESKITQFDTENATLRRRLTDALDHRDREAAQYQTKIGSLESEISLLMDDIARMRRNPTTSIGGGERDRGGEEGDTQSAVSLLLLSLLHIRPPLIHLLHHT